MLMDGKIFKNSNYWLAEIPLLDVMSQGRTEAEAKRMLGAAIKDLLNDGSVSLHVKDGESKGELQLVIGSADEHVGPFLSFVLRRIRETQGLTIKDVAKMLGNKSLNSYAQYEQARHPSWEQFRHLMGALSPKTVIQERVS